MSDPTPTPTPAPALKREFDQILSGDVTIKKLCNSDDEYKITFSKKKKQISKMLIYQVWSDSNTIEGKKLNENREVYETTAKKWVKSAFPKPPPAVPFTPTTVMEHGNKKYVFVINDAKVNANGHVVFYVSSKHIDPNSTNKTIKKLKKIPQGKFQHARFDIDFYGIVLTSPGCYSCVMSANPPLNCNNIFTVCPCYKGVDILPAC
jgi:hypothetical protein